MNDVVNLNKARKAKRKQEETKKAQENRVLHGLTKAERQTQKAERLRTEIHLVQKRLERDNFTKKVDGEQ